MKCPYCYTDLPDTAKFCYKCKSNLPGSSAETEKRPCPNCGVPLPVTAKECYVCKIKFDLGGTLSPASIVEKESGTLNGSAGSFQPGYKPYTKLPQNNNTVKAKPTKQSTGGCGAVLLVIVILIAIYAYSQKNKTKDDESSNEPQVTNTTQSAQETSKTTTQADVSPLDKKLASDMKNMKIGEVGKKNKVYLSLAYVKRSNEMHYLSVTDYTDSDHEILYFFVDIFNDSNDKKTISDSNFNCYIDGSQVDHFDCMYLFTEDEVSEYNSNEIDSGCARLLALDYEVPLEWSEAKLYYGSDCIWIVKNSDVSDEAYDGRKIINADYSYQNTPENKTIYSGDYELIYDGFEYYDTENYYTDVVYAVFKFTINAKTEVDSSLVGYNMRCYQNNYLTDDATYIMDDKIDDYINIFSVDEIHEGMSAKIYVAFEIPKKGGDFRMVFDDGYIADNKIADVYVVDTDDEE